MSSLQRLAVWCAKVWPNGQHARVVEQYRSLRQKPELLADIAMRGGIWSTRLPPDGHQLAFEQGRRSLALEIIEMSRIDPGQLAQILELNLARKESRHD
jgi:hypothetical protein